MRSTLAVFSTLLILTSACGGDYGRSTSPSGGYTYPPPVTPVDTQPTPRSIRSIVLTAPESILVAERSTELAVFALDSSGQQVGRVRNATFTNTNAFSFAVSPDGVLTALYSSFRPFRATITASAVIDGVTFTASKRFDVRSSEPARIDFLTSLQPESVRPEPTFSAADGIVYLAVTDSGVDFTLLWSKLTGHPIGAHIHGPAEFDGVAGVLADFPVADQFATHGLIRGTLTAASIRARDGRAAISVDSLVTLIQNRAVYVDIHSAEQPAGELRGTPFASALTATRVPLTLGAPAAAAAPRTSRSPRSSRG